VRIQEYLPTLNVQSADTLDDDESCTEPHESPCKSQLMMLSENIIVSSQSWNSTADSLFKEADDVFFNHVINNSQHVLQPMLPAKRDSRYNLRTRTHNRLLIDKSADLNDCDFVIGMLYKSSYQFLPSLFNFSFFNLVISCVCQPSIKNNDDDGQR